jgi:hypothetical protein
MRFIITILFVLLIIITILSSCEKGINSSIWPEKHCEIHLRTGFDHTAVKVFVDYSQVFSDTISTGSILAFAAIFSVNLSEGKHILKVTAADSVSKGTTFVIHDTLYIGVHYGQTIQYEFKSEPYYYR